MNITVTFMRNDGSDCVFLKKEMEKGSYLSFDNVPARDGYSFDGWYTEPACENRFGIFAGRIKNDTVLYAKWIAPVTDYSKDYTAARKAFSHFLEYNEPSIEYLNATVILNSLLFPLSKNMAQAAEAKPEDRNYLDRLRFSVKELVRIHEEGYKLTPLWGKGNMPKVTAWHSRMRNRWTLQKALCTQRKISRKASTIRPASSCAATMTAPPTRSDAHSRITTIQKTSCMIFRSNSISSTRFPTAYASANSIRTSTADGIWLNTLLPTISEEARKGKIQGGNK